MNNKKLLHKLKGIKILLTIIQFFSVFGIITFGLVIKGNCSVISKHNEYIPDFMIIDTAFTSGGGSPGNNTTIAEGLVNGRRKSVLLIPKISVRDSIGDWKVIPVWNIPRKKGNIILRKLNEKKFPVDIYKISNYKFIFFGYLPIILVWIFRYLIAKKIKKIEQF